MQVFLRSLLQSLVPQGLPTCLQSRVYADLQMSPGHLPMCTSDPQIKDKNCLSSYLNQRLDALASLVKWIRTAMLLAKPKDKISSGVGKTDIKTT